ncbi:hypothetical protein ACFE04_030795 [Oxalis oulophora]
MLGTNAQNLKVSDLLHFSPRAWKVDVVEQLFVPEDARSVLAVPLAQGRWDDIMMSCISAFAQNGRDLYVVFTDILLLVMRKHGGIIAAFVFGRTVICRDMDVATRVARNDGLDVAKSKGDRVVICNLVVITRRDLYYMNIELEKDGDVTARAQAIAGLKALRNRSNNFSVSQAVIIRFLSQEINYFLILVRVCY